MIAAETIQAAIDKLEALKAKTTLGPWFLTYERTTYPRVWGNLDEDGADPVAVTEGWPANAELIVALHRTIDAQLVILRHTLSHYRGDLGIGANRMVVDLARSILGESS